jgi:ABC-type multidrug transport system ATPase subunit
MPGRFSLYPDLSVEENLKFFATIFGTTIEANYDLIRDIYVQIEPFKDRRAGALSGGMKQKLALCCALIHRPHVLFLDEPTTGVDAVSRREFWDMLGRLKAEGLTIVVSTPYMDEAVRCDRIALIQNGRLLAVDEPEAIARSYERPLYAVKSGNRLGALRSLRAHPQVHSVYAFGEELHFADRRSIARADEIRAYLVAADIPDVEVSSIGAGIEDVFMERMQSHD